MIFCFSGTGNSRNVARLLANHLGDEIIMLEGKTLLNPPAINCANHKRVIWVFPIYSWGVPPVVANFIKLVSLDSAKEIPHFMVATCGDDAGLAHRQWKSIIKTRGWDGKAAYTVIMPNTYTLMKGFDVDTTELATAKLNAAPETVKHIANEILSDNTTDKVIKGKFSWIKTHVIYPLFVRNAMSPRPFYATDTCTNCGLCSRDCPTCNISMKNGKPQWGDNCAMCLRCYHACPVHAIAYGKATLSKGQYLNKN